MHKVLSRQSLLENLAVTFDLQRVLPQEDELISSGRADTDRIRNDLREDEEKVYRILKTDAMSVDEIAASCDLTLLQTMNALLGLQLKHCAEEVSKNRYSLKLAS